MKAGPKAELADRPRVQADLARQAEADPVQAVIDFFPKYIVHVKGALAGKPYELGPWELEAVENIYGTIREDGKRLYQTASVMIARKNSKSTFVAGLAMYHLVNGGTDGIGGEIYACARDRGQAAVIGDIAASMCRMNPKLNALTQVYKNEIRHPFSGSIFKALASDSASHLGKNASVVLFDEFTFLNPRGGDFYRTMRTSQGARVEPLLIEISTAATFDPASFGWIRYLYLCKVRDGLLDGKRLRHWVKIYEADKEDDPGDPATWAKANPNLGRSVDPEFLEREYAMAVSSPSDMNAFQRFYCGIWTHSVDGFFDLDAWQDCQEEPQIPDGAVCYAGLDLGQTTDLCSLALVFPRPDGMIDVLTRNYLPEAKALKAQGYDDPVNYREWAEQGHCILTPGSVTDYAFIRRDINELAERYNLKVVAADRWNASQLLIELAEQDGIEVVSIGQGYISLSPPFKELQRNVIARTIRFGKQPLLFWCAANTTAEEDAAGNIKPSKGKSVGGRIDPVVALTMAIAMSSQHGHKGESVYATRGIRTL